jgi:hypothetical protein
MASMRTSGWKWFLMRHLPFMWSITHKKCQYGNWHKRGDVLCYCGCGLNGATEPERLDMGMSTRGKKGHKLLMRLLALLFRERLAELAHDGIWATWMEYQYSKCTETMEDPPNPSLRIPAWAVMRWGRQMATPYEKLPESERASDREQADKIIATLCGGDWREFDS